MTMPTLKEMADEHARAGRAAGTEAIRRRSFMQGAKAAVDAAAESFEPNCNYAGHLVCSRIRALIPTE